MSTKLTLTNPNDSDLDAAFAEKVAGWQMREVFCGVDGTSTKRLCKPGDIHANYREEGFTRSMDAVLPWLEKGHWEARYSFYSSSLKYDVRVYQDEGISAEAEASALPRACVIALLRANGVEVEFTK